MPSEDASSPVRMPVLPGESKGERQVVDRGDGVYDGDCLVHLAKIPAGSVQLVFADPPYNRTTRASTTAAELPLISFLAASTDSGSGDGSSCVPRPWPTTAACGC